MIKLSNNVSLSDNEVELIAIRAQGSGGQNVNKVSSAIHLRFDIKQSSLPEFYKERLLNLNDNRINQDGVLVIKAQKFRTQEKNKEDAINRMVGLIKESVKVEKKRKKTKPSKSSQRKRIESKKKHGQNKRLRGKVDI
ncbi:alternative ribosome rescue aminoacyl-tRNA hydrolase ArfB [Pleionea mediterranea]|jgi:ribosome-associated protein|uniref:Ribosome-associated protein n=1 Tax=Pleionea mediterranea TaxID=523701 RepID=A0A316FRB0_9GAMM|nr:alternative ribosome rescue aminoacyl-tRNA hydrolase ArfB [Pleionea mediterranea]PWK50715.1 ribosome-associated protein [Pleionea mediterranea]